MGFRGCEPGRMAMSVCARTVTAPLLLGPTPDTQCFSLTGDSTRAVPKSLLDCLEQYSLLYPVHGPREVSMWTEGQAQHALHWGQRDRPTMQCVGGLVCGWETQLMRLLPQSLVPLGGQTEPATWPGAHLHTEETLSW